KLRRAYVTAIGGLSSRSLLATVVNETWRTLRQPEVPPGVSTVLRWRRKYLNAGKDIRALIEQDNKKGNRSPRYPQEVEKLTRKAIEKVYLAPERKTLKDTLEEAERLVDEENTLRP